VAAYLVAAIIAVSFSYDLMRKPIQVTDSLVEMLDVQQSPSLYATFVDVAQRPAYLRPLRLVQIKALFDLADGHYQLVYRGFHALLLIAALLLFTRALRVATWSDFAASVFALTVLTGLHTFRGTVREAFPINHFLEIVVFCLIALNLAQSRSGWWIDVAAALTFVVASLTLESGLLVWVVLVAAWAWGMRGVSRRGLVAMTMLVGVYFWARFVLLSVGTPGLDERDSGYWLTMLEPDDLVRRFGANPIWFYLYNVGASMLSVLFSDPDRGVFQTMRTWLEGGVPARLYLVTVSSAMTTGLIAWVVLARLRGRARTMPVRSEQFLIIFAAVLVANAAVSYAYTKHEIMSVAGAFYAYAAFAAARHAIDHVRLSGPSNASRAALCVTLAVMASLWTFRSVGVHHMLQSQAFEEQLEWARLDPDKLADRGYPSDARSRALASKLRQEALDIRMANPHMLPSWPDTWWDE
jgi:hypothetical protein